MANLSDYVFMKEKKHSEIRVCWFLVYIVFTILTTGLVITLWNEFLTNPIITTLEDRDYPVDEVPFPGIGICNINKISRKRAIIFAQKHFPGQNESQMLKTVSIFGKLYDFDYSSDDDEIIQNVDTVFNRQKLDLFSVMTELASDCGDLLFKCHWRGTKVNCSDIFRMRLTYSGYCCMFNYIKNTTNYDAEDEVSVRGVQGIKKGLSVLLNNDIDDYLYAPLSSQGVTVLVFEPKDYPDKPSGSLTEIIANVNTETFVEITPTTVVSVQDVAEYPLSKRQCLFDEERLTKFAGDYSQSDCNVDCRVSSSLALCGCIPFMIPLSTEDNVCTLNNLECLNRYRNKWNFLYPEDDTSGLLKREEHDSLRCAMRCYPSCSGTSYEVISDRAPLHKTKKHNYTATIRIYYGDKFSHLYKQDVVYYWFEILSNFGGTFGLIIGMSMVSLIECLLFALQFLRKKIHH